MTPRPDVSEERKAQILDAATAVFARRGFHKARMEDIAEEAGLSKGTLYLYFESKDDIISALLKRFYQRALGSLPEMVTAGGSASERLELIGRVAVAETQNMLEELPISFEFYAVAARQEKVRGFLKDYFAQSRSLLAALVQQGVDSGEFRPVDADVAALTMGALFEGLGLLWMIDPQSIDWEEDIATVFDLLLDGLRAERQ